MTANKFIAEVDAPEFGEGCTIRLDLKGQAVLESRFGEFIFADKVNWGLATMSAPYLEAFLEVALRKNGEVTPATNGVLENGPLEPIAKKCQDAYWLFRHGMTAEEHNAKNAKSQDEGKTANPTKGTKA